MTNHTPGPWTINPSDIGGWDIDAIRADGQVACVAFARHADNARLIAAAPDLLAALHALMSYCDEHLPVEDMNREQSLALRAVRTQVRTAIAKAEGARHE